MKPFARRGEGIRTGREESMRKNELRKTLAGGGTVLNGWLSLANSYSAEIMAHQGFDSVAIGLQHVAVAYPPAVRMLVAVSTNAVGHLFPAPQNESILPTNLLEAALSTPPYYAS